VMTSLFGVCAIPAGAVRTDCCTAKAAACRIGDANDRLRLKYNERSEHDHEVSLDLYPG
jgi:hypothetical protein